MQPDSQDVGRAVLSPSVVAQAREAFLRDDLQTSLRILDGGISTLPPALQREAILLRGRILLRQLRHAEAVSLLGRSLRSFNFVDEACTARMLYGVAVARSGKVDRGLRLLTELDAAARTLEPHVTIRAELAYWIAFVYWLKGDHRATLTHARIAEAARADVVSVRAAALRGFVAIAKQCYPEALALFRSAFNSYSQCAERDDDLRGRIVMQIAALEMGLRSEHVRGTHDLRDGAGRIKPEASSAPNVHRMQVAAMDGWLYALDGARRDAYDHVRLSENFAPSKAWRVWALANRALLSAAFGDQDIAFVFARDALEAVPLIDWEQTADEERFGLLMLAEALARTEPAAAPAIFERYNRLTSKIDRALLYAADVRLSIAETFVRGLMHRIAGRFVDARSDFRTVHETAQPIGLLWQAAQALIELDSTPLIDDPTGYDSLHRAALIVKDNFPLSFLNRRLGKWATIYRDPIAAKLSAKPRGVLRLLLMARSTKDIAVSLGISGHTVRDYVDALLRAFNVHSKEELLVECYRRGIGDPAWWSLLDEPPQRVACSDEIPAGTGRSN